MVALPPVAGDSGSQESDIEDFAGDMADIFKPLENLR